MIGRIFDAEVFQIDEAKWRVFCGDLWQDGSSLNEAMKNFQEQFPDNQYRFRFHIL